MNIFSLGIFFYCSIKFNFLAILTTLWKYVLTVFRFFCFFVFFYCNTMTKGCGTIWALLFWRIIFKF